MMNDSLWTASVLGVLAAFLALIGCVLALDLRAHRRRPDRAPTPISLANAALWSGIWIAASLAFAGWIVWLRGWDDATSFLAGYAMEKALSVDNLIVFGATFAYFRIAPEFRHRALHYGVAGAVVFRLVFVDAGLGSLTLFGRWAEAGLACLVAWSAWGMIRGALAESGDDAQPIAHEARWYIKWTRAALPIARGDYGDKFFVRIAGRLLATRMVLCVVAIEVCDALFAFDSAPAVIAVTQDPLLAYGAMMFAIMGLRSLYFVLDALRRFLTQLDKAVVAILAFIAVKMALHAAGVCAISPGVSLAVVAALLAAGVGASLIWAGDGKSLDDKPAAAKPA